MKIRRVNYSPDEFLAAISSLTVEEIGFYWVCCTLIYSKRGPIDADSVWLDASPVVRRGARRRWSTRC